MLLCIVAVATLSSCTKEKFDVNELIGTTWKCTYNCKTLNCEENAYVGTIWKLSSEKVPYSRLNKHYAYKNGVKMGTYTLSGGIDPELDIDILDPNNDDWVYDDFFGGEIYHIEKNKNELVLSAYVTNYDGSRSLQVFLKFVQQ